MTVQHMEVSVTSEVVFSAFTAHKLAWGTWAHGQPVKAWRDTKGTLCIRYASGTWWHYAYEGSTLVWW